MIDLARDEFEAAIREALEHLWVPSFLCRSPLLDLECVRWQAEQKSFPATPTDLARALRDTLREALDTMKPQVPEQRGARRWRAYYLLHYTYWEELPGDVAATRLYISRRTYYRDLAKAISQLTDVLHDMEASLEGQALPLAKWVEAIPAIKGFVGRVQELADYQAQWAAHRLIVLEGIAGTGKTSLGAELVQRHAEGRPIFWYTFRRGLNDDLHSVLLALAAFLTRQGNSSLWRFLQLSGEAATPRPLNLKISYLVNSLEAEYYVLCFDDFHLVDGDTRLGSLFDALQDRAKAAQLPLLVISRSTPGFVKELVCPPLKGLNQPDARQLLVQAGLSDLPEDVLAELYARTGGNPQLLNLFVAWTMGQKGTGGDWQRFVAAMPRTREVHHYLLHNVYESLAAGERELVKVLALLRPPAGYPAIEAVVGESGGRDAKAAIHSLARKHVVEERAGEENVVFFHPIVREFCYGLLDQDVRREWHSRVGAHFERIEDPIEAAYHYLHAGAHDRGAEILTSQAETLINRGQGRPLLDLLTRLDQCQLTPEQWLAVCLAEGEVLVHTAAYEEAVARLQATLLLPHLSGRQRARIFYKLSWIHDVLGDMDQALAYAQQGMELFEDQGNHPPESGPLLQVLAWIHHRRGANQQAYELISWALEVMERDDGYAKEVGQCYRARGMIALALGHLRQAEADTRRGLEISERIGHTSGVAMAFNNLGFVASKRERWEEARTYYEQSLVLREQIGDAYGLGMSYSNLGGIYFCQGDLARSREYLEKALALTSNMGMRRAVSVTLGTLAEVLAAEGDHQGAFEHLRRAVEIAEADGYWNYAVYFYQWAAVTLLDREEHSQALDNARRALQIAKKIEEPFRQAKAHKVLGQVLLAQGKTDEARTHLREALDIARSCERGQEEMVAEITAILSGLERQGAQETSHHLRS